MFLRFFIVFATLNFTASLNAADNVAHYLEDRGFKIDVAESRNIKSLLDLDTIAIAKGEAFVPPNSIVARDQFGTLNVLSIGNLTTHLHILMMINLSESLGVRSVGLYPTYFNINQPDALEFLNNSQRKQLRLFLETQTDKNTPFFVPAILTPTVTKESIGNIAFSNNNRKSFETNPVTSVENLISSATTSLLSYVQSIEDPQRMNIDDVWLPHYEIVHLNIDQRPGYDRKHFREIITRTDDWKYLRSLTEKDVEFFVQRISINLSRIGDFAKNIHEHTMFKLIFSSPELGASAGTPFKLYQVVASITKRRGENVSSLYQTFLKERIGGLFKQSRFEIKKSEDIQEQLSQEISSQAKIPYQLKPNDESSIKLIAKTARRGHERELLYSLLFLDSMTSAEMVKQWQNYLDTSEPIVATLLREAKLWDATYILRGLTSRSSLHDTSQKLPQISLAVSSPPSLLIIPENDVEMSLIKSTSQEISKKAKLRSFVIKNAPRPFRLSEDDAKQIATMARGQRLILCEVANANSPNILKILRQFDSEVVILDHHNFELNEWRARSTAEQFWDLYSYRPNATELLAVARDRGGLYAVAQTVDKESRHTLFEISDKFGIYNAKRLLLNELAFSYDKKGNFYRIGGGGSREFSRDLINFHLGRKHYPHPVQFIKVSQSRFTFQGAPDIAWALIDRFKQTKPQKNAVWMGDLNSGMLVILPLSELDSSDHWINFVRDLAEKQPESHSKYNLSPNICAKAFTEKIRDI